MPEQGEYVFFNFILTTNNLLQHIQHGTFLSVHPAVCSQKVRNI